MKTTIISGVVLAILPAALAAQDFSGAYYGGSLSLGNAELDIADDNEYSSYGFTQMATPSAGISGRVGYNMQSGQMVFGPELTVGFVALVDTEDATDFCSPSLSRNELSGVATLAGRIGFANDNMLVYGKVGAAYLYGEAALQCDTAYTDAVDATMGIVSGLGVEYLMTSDYSVTFEYSSITGLNEATSADDDSEDEIVFNRDLSSFSVGVNYRF